MFLDQCCEMHQPARMLQHWAPRLRGRTVSLQVENRSVVAYLIKEGGTRSRPLMYTFPPPQLIPQVALLHLPRLKASLNHHAIPPLVVFVTTLSRTPQPPFTFPGARHHSATTPPIPCWFSKPPLVKTHSAPFHLPKLSASLSYHATPPLLVFKTILIRTPSAPSHLPNL